jgi:hypothetical protein
MAQKRRSTFAPTPAQGTVIVKQALIEIRQTGIDNVCFLAEKLQP